MMAGGSPLGSPDMTVAAGDGLLLKGILACPDRPIGSSFPLAVLAPQYRATAGSGRSLAS